MWWKTHRWKIIVPIILVAVLAAAFWYGGSAPGLQGWTVEKTDHTSQTETAPADASGTGDAQTTPIKDPDTETTPSIEALDTALEDTPGLESEAAQASAPGAEDLPEDTQTAPIKDSDTETAPGGETPAVAPEDAPGLEGGTAQTPAPTQLPTDQGTDTRPGGAEGGLSADDKVALAEQIAGGSSSGVMSGDKAYSEAQGMVIDPSTGKDRYLTDPVPEGKPLPVEPQDAAISDTAHTCTLSISCAAILDHMDWLDPEKIELVPEDGWILKPTEVTFYEGESVFNVLQRVCKQNRIHMEFENTPIYNSAYIEGIHNLYEFDCGELSGWMYKVNDWFPNYGCSRYALKPGDVICWEYTCDLGVDVGGFYSIGS